MTDIVEHVARAIYERGPSYIEDVCIPWDRQRDGKREVHRDDARAAIRATLEYARDNVSENMVVTGRLADDVLGKFVDGVLGHTDPREAVEGIFRAMITTLLAELDGTESEGR